MDKRFNQIGTMAFAQASDCPLKAEAITLWRDTENNVLFITPKLRNEYPVAVTEFTVGYDAVDANGNVIERERGYLINDCADMVSGASFGEDMPITMQESGAVGGRFFIELAVFADGYIWRPESANAESVADEQTDEDPNVTMVQTVSGFGPDGPTFRKVPLSKIIAQRLTSQFVTTVIAIVLCVFSLAQQIALAMSSEKDLVDSLTETLSAMTGSETDEEKEEEYLQLIEEGDLVIMARAMYVAGAVMVGASVLFSLYMVFYLREMRKHLRDNAVPDAALSASVRKLKVLSIIEIVVCAALSFNVFGLFAGISGISTASLHGRVMKNKKENQTPKI